MTSLIPARSPHAGRALEFVSDLQQRLADEVRASFDSQKREA